MLSYENRLGNGIAPPTPPNEEQFHPISTSNSKLNASMASTTTSSTAPAHAHIWLITGPAGCGKTSVAEYVAKSLGLPYIEGDSFHPQSNIDKMAQGIPLQDSDRWDWLTILRDRAIDTLATSSGVVVTCSALKRKYRDVIRSAPSYADHVSVHFIYLHATEEVLLERVGNRKGHYMGAQMVHSQFEALEEPGEVERDVITVDVGGSLEEVEMEVVGKMREVLDRELA